LDNKQASSLLIENGRVGSRWLFSISLVIVMNFLVLKTPTTIMVGYARYHIGQSNGSATTYYNHIIELGALVESIICNTKASLKLKFYVTRMKSTPIFMYGFCKIRGTLNSPALQGRKKVPGMSIFVCTVMLFHC
jgi:hypothetical protein